MIVQHQRWSFLEARCHEVGCVSARSNSTPCAGHDMSTTNKERSPFFQMSAAEASALDPQQRLMLECTYEAMESSGTTMEQFCGSNTSVFAGAFTTDYTDLLWRDAEATPMYQCTNAAHSRSNLANRLSYFFDLRGQSVAIDTACSTSLVGLHLGCQSLRTGESKLSIVAGANIVLNHEVSVTMSMMR